MGTNQGCIDLDDVVIEVQFELPPEVYLSDFDTRGDLLEPRASVDRRRITRFIEIAALGQDEARQFDFEFVVCRQAKAAADGIRIIAFLSRIGDNHVEHPSGTYIGQRHSLETNDPRDEGRFDAANGDDEADALERSERVTIIRRFDDQTCSRTATVQRGAILNVVATCDEPRLYADKQLQDVITSSSSSFTSTSDLSSSSSLSTSDVSVQKLTTCFLRVSNTGFSDVGVKVENWWDLPQGTHVAKWTASEGVFSGNVWALNSATSGDWYQPDSCPAKTGDTATLVVYLVSNQPGTIQWVAKANEAASSALFDDQSVFGNAVTVEV